MVHGDLIITFPKPYSIYLRGTINSPWRNNVLEVTKSALLDSLQREIQAAGLGSGGLKNIQGEMGTCRTCCAWVP